LGWCLGVNVSSYSIIRVNEFFFIKIFLRITRYIEGASGFGIRLKAEQSCKKHGCAEEKASSSCLYH
jgi:hypothetical protein